jgi:hypothetical protein
MGRCVSKVKMVCSVCKKSGHYKTTCSQRVTAIAVPVPAAPAEVPAVPAPVVPAPLTPPFKPRQDTVTFIFNLPRNVTTGEFMMLKHLHETGLSTIQLDKLPHRHEYEDLPHITLCANIGGRELRYHVYHTHTGQYAYMTGIVVENGIRRIVRIAEFRMKN